MASLNKVMLVGRLGQEPEKKLTKTGKSVVSVGLATSSAYKDAAGNKQESTEWHKLVFWGNLADNICQYTKKGSLLYVEGRLETTKWEKDSITMYTTQIVVSNMQFLDSKNTVNAQPSQQPSNPKPNPEQKIPPPPLQKGTQQQNQEYPSAPTYPQQQQTQQQTNFNEDDIPF